MLTYKYRIKDSNKTGRVFLKDLEKIYGLRAVELSKATTSSKQKRLILGVAKALDDLADILGLPRKAMGLSREFFYPNLEYRWTSEWPVDRDGTGGGVCIDLNVDPTLHEGWISRLAAYSFDEHRIFIRRHGAGVFAHEWFHALDRFGATRGYSMTNCSPRHTTGTVRLFAEIKTVIQKSRSTNGAFLSVIRDTEMPDQGEHQRHAFASLDSASLRKLRYYLNKPTEMAAMAFEGYVARKLKKAGRKNPFLVDMARADPPEKNLLNTVYPCLQTEKDAIDRHFDEIFENIRRALKKPQSI